MAKPWLPGSTQKSNSLKQNIIFSTLLFVKLIKFSDATRIISIVQYKPLFIVYKLFLIKNFKFNNVENIIKIRYF